MSIGAIGSGQWAMGKKEKDQWNPYNLILRPPFILNEKEFTYGLQPKCPYEVGITSRLFSNMISQHQFHGVGMEVILAFEIRLSVFSDVVGDQSDGHDEGDKLLIAIFNNFK